MVDVDKCPRCGKSVYAAEKIMGGGKVSSYYSTRNKTQFYKGDKLQLTGPWYFKFLLTVLMKKTWGWISKLLESLMHFQV